MIEAFVLIIMITGWRQSVLDDIKKIPVLYIGSFHEQILVLCLIFTLLWQAASGFQNYFCTAELSVANMFEGSTLRCLKSHIARMERLLSLNDRFELKWSEENPKLPKKQVKIFCHEISTRALQLQTCFY